jgi:Cd2+/Zn2+-exporting ATPase
VLFRGGAAVEHLAEIGTVAMDKTGTLTEGSLRLAEVQCHEGNEAEALRIAGGLARLSNHPISRSLARETVRRGVVSAAFPHTETIAGQGIRTVAGEPLHALGNRALLGERISPALLTTIPELPAGANETWVTGPGVLARLLSRDQLRPEAAALVGQLQTAGLRTVMLTGDRESAAHRLAEEAGLTEYRAQLMPEDKVAAVEQLKQAGRPVAMIGDGVNDAPVLAAADVGIAMGARGSDAALEQADVVLMNDRLENFVFARRLSLRARSIIRQNLVISLGTMTLMALVTLGFSGVPLSVGVAAHEGSTVIVVLNSLRLLFPPKSP